MHENTSAWGGNHQTMIEITKYEEKQKGNNTENFLECTPMEMH